MVDQNLRDRVGMLEDFVSTAVTKYTVSLVTHAYNQQVLHSKLHTQLASSKLL